MTAINFILAILFDFNWSYIYVCKYVPCYIFSIWIFLLRVCYRSIAIIRTQLVCMWTLWTKKVALVGSQSNPHTNKSWYDFMARTIKTRASPNLRILSRDDGRRRRGVAVGSVGGEGRCIDDKPKIGFHSKCNLPTGNRFGRILKPVSYVQTESIVVADN